MPCKEIYWQIKINKYHKWIMVNFLFAHSLPDTQVKTSALRSTKGDMFSNVYPRYCYYTLFSDKKWSNFTNWEIILLILPETKQGNVFSLNFNKDDKNVTKNDMYSHGFWGSFPSSDIKKNLWKEGINTYTGLIFVTQLFPGVGRIIWSKVKHGAS